MSNFILFNQNNYSNIPYPNNGSSNANIKTSGCGICSMAMILANLAKVDITIKELAKFSINNGARASSGTNMIKLSKAIIKKYPQLTYTTTNSETELRKHMESGGMAIMNADGDDGCDGIFAHGGHYLVILGVRNGRPVIGDPAYTYNRYKTNYRKKYVTELGDNLIACDWSTLDLDTKHRSPNYYLFKNVSIKNEEVEDDEMTRYTSINEVPDYGKESVQLRIDLKVSDGKDLTESMVRCWVIEDRENPFIKNLDQLKEEKFEQFKWAIPEIDTLLKSKKILGNDVYEIGMRFAELRCCIINNR